MGRIRQRVPVGNFIFKNKANAKGKRILYLRYYVNGLTVVMSTGVSVYPDEWDEIGECVKRSNIAHERLNDHLQKLRETIENCLLSLDLIAQSTA